MYISYFSGCKSKPGVNIVKLFSSLTNKPNKQERFSLENLSSLVQHFWAKLVAYLREGHLKMAS
jgi:hypothetical protein